MPSDLQEGLRGGGRQSCGRSRQQRAHIQLLEPLPPTGRQKMVSGSFAWCPQRACLHQSRGPLLPGHNLDKLHGHEPDLYATERTLAMPGYIRCGGGGRFLREEKLDHRSLDHFCRGEGRGGLCGPDFGQTSPSGSVAVLPSPSELSHVASRHTNKHLLHLQTGGVRLTLCSRPTLNNPRSSCPFTHDVVRRADHGPSLLFFSTTERTFSQLHLRTSTVSR